MKLNKILRDLSEFITLKNVVYGTFLCVGAYAAYRKAKVMWFRQEAKKMIIDPSPQAHSNPHPQVKYVQLPAPPPEVQTQYVQYPNVVAENQRLRAELEGLREQQQEISEDYPFLQNVPNNQVPNGINENGDFF